MQAGGCICVCVFVWNCVIFKVTLGKNGIEDDKHKRYSSTSTMTWFDFIWFLHWLWWWRSGGSIPKRPNKKQFQWRPCRSVFWHWVGENTNSLSRPRNVVLFFFFRSSPACSPPKVIPTKTDNTTRSVMISLRQFFNFFHGESFNERWKFRWPPETHQQC